MANRSATAFPRRFRQLPGLFDMAGDREDLASAIGGLPAQQTTSPPLRMIDGTEENDSVLLMVVNQP